MNGAHRMRLSTRARSLANLRRRIAEIGATPARRVLNAHIYLQQYAVAGRLARLWSHLITWELDRDDRLTVSAALETASEQAHDRG